jgi:hypothetical protein|tara:strand:- start:678 stop:1154 length:477 start_codon:yes stop_codon:yes gene_type:complete
MSGDNSGTFRYTAGLNHVGSYQASARPFVINKIVVPASASNLTFVDGTIEGGAAGGTAVEIAFPKVTKFVTIKNEGADQSSSCEMRLAFSTGGLDDTKKNYIILAESASFSADFRITRLYLMGNPTAVTASVIAGLTNIPAQHLTSSWDDLVGVNGLP